MDKSRKVIRKFICMFMTFLIVSNIVFQNNVEGEVSGSVDKKLDEFVLEQIENGGIPGLSIAITKENKTIYQKGFGYADVDDNEAMEPETFVEIASNSKAFTGLAVLKLQSEGLIDLNEHITKYIPWMDFKYRGKSVEVKVEHFMQHTSGVPYGSIGSIQISNDEDAIKKAVETLVGIELDSEPGTAYNYATINYDVLGYLIEMVSGRKYEEYIKESILKPLNMNDTFLLRDNVTGYMATGYKRSFFRTAEFDAPEYRGNLPAGYIISNVADMAQWMKFQLGFLHNNVIKQDLVETSHNLSHNIPGEPPYTAGWHIGEKSPSLIYHGGDNPNYSSFVIIDKKEKIGITVLANIQSERIQEIAWGAFDIINGSSFMAEVEDANKRFDTIASIGIIVLILSLMGILVLLALVLAEIFKKKRRFTKITIKGVIGFIVSITLVSYIGYCIYIIPRVFIGINSWEFCFVWMPYTLRTVLVLFALNVSMIFLVFFLRALFKKNESKSLFELILLSIISGFGNALVIFSINLAIANDIDRLGLLTYFILGIVLYVYGQRVVRVNLIKYTNNLVYKKRVDVLNKLLKASFEKYEKIENGRIHATLNNDTERVSLFANTLVEGITAGVTLIFTSIYLGIISIKALGLALALIAVIAGVYSVVGRYADKLWEEGRDLQNNFFDFINHLTNGFKELSLNIFRKNQFETDMKKTCNDYKKKISKAEVAFANMFVIGELLFTLAIGGVVFIFPLILKDLDSVKLSTYVFVLLYMTGPVHGVLNVIPQSIQVKISWKRINELLKEINTLKGQDIKEEDLELFDKATIQLKDIEYSYEQNKDEDNSFKVGPISHEFKFGEITFITGGNGSGKSTLAKLLTGLYSPSKGYIALNNENIHNQMLSQHTSAIFSDFHLFEKLYGIDCEKQEGEIKKYLQILKMDKKVEVERDKFSTIKLSTGQKKRLALLITYLEDKPIYLFDEWAADQDPEFRKFFYEELLPELRSRGKCVIVITHDEHYFSVCDKSIKMEMGELIEYSH